MPTYTDSDAPVRRGELAIPSGRLAYELRGSGPPLLVIHGSFGDAALVAPLAERLGRAYTVITYDRRGSSHSRVEGVEEPPPGAWQDVHAGDAARVLEAVTGGPAYVLGSSAGAIVGVELLTRRPELVRGLVAHEPPILSVLPEAARLEAFMTSVYDLYTREGVHAALARFVDGLGLAPPVDVQGPTAPPRPELAAMFERMAANGPITFEHELRQCTAYRPEFDVLASRADRIVWGVGAESGDSVVARPVAVLAERIGGRVEAFPGDHAGYGPRPAEFADRAVAVLAAMESRRVR